jgi:hypothetical protein
MPKISVLLSDAEDQRFDAYCHDKGFKKSTLVVRLIREHLDKEGYGAQGSLFSQREPPGQLGRTDDEG